MNKFYDLKLGLNQPLLCLDEDGFSNFNFASLVPVFNYLGPLSLFKVIIIQMYYSYVQLYCTYL